jgi:toxin ParE1/3/4
MKPRIIRPDRVKLDLKELAKIIGPFHGKRFLAAAEAAMRRLSEMPFLAGTYESENPLLADIRVWPIPGFENYLIFYRPIENGIGLVRVLYGGRDIERVLGS